MLVPDKITETHGRRDWSSSKDVPVDARTIVLALCTDEYHDNWYFSDPKSIVLEEITDA